MSRDRLRSLLALGVALTGMLLGPRPVALALDPSLDVSQYAHTAWKVRDGFAKGQINRIAQTPDGYLWLGTESGLLRFDGVRAVPWQPPGSAQLSSNFISGLLVAHDGTLWIGTLNGLASYRDGKLTQYPGLAGALIGSFLEDREQTVWFGTRQAAIGRLCSIRDERIECYGAGTFGAFAYPLYEDHKGNLWVNSETGLWRWAPGPPERYGFPRGVTAVMAMTQPEDSGTLLLGTSDGLKRLVAGRLQNYPLPGVSGHFAPSRFLRSRDGSLWIGTAQGLLHLHQGRVDRFGATDGLAGDFVNTIFEDREGSVWVATADGLDRFREFAVPTISRNQGLSNPTAGLVQGASDGSIWIGTAEGLNRWADGRLSFYRGRSALSENRAADETKLRVSGAATEITNSGLLGTPHSLGLDDEGRLWASTDKGLFYFERGRFVSASGGPGGNTFAIAGDGHAGVWILQSENLFRWSPDAAVQQIPWSQFGQRTGRAMLADREPGSLWLGFYEGGLVFLKDGKVVRSYGAGVGLGDGRVNHLRFGPNGGLWAATEGGLSRIKDERIATMTQKNGLPCDEVHWSMEDADHAVWLYQPCGLVRIGRPDLDAWINDPKYVLKTTVFDNSDGVRSVGIYGAAGPHVTKSPDGRIWFVPRDGLSVIDPRHLPFNRLPSPVYIEQITADHKAYSVNSDAYGSVRLPPLIRDLQIDYTALSFVAPERVQFRYKLEGWERDWQDAGTRRQAFYSNLPPRNYRFRVMACNNSGVWNVAGAALDFSVAPAYYQATWFRLSCVAAFLALLVALYHLRLRQVAQEFNMRMEERVNERTRIAQDLHDTLLQGVLSASMQLNVANDQLADDAPAKALVVRVLELMGHVVDDGRNALQGLRPSRDRKHDLDQAFSRVPQELAFSGTADFRVIVEGTPCALQPVIRDEVYRIGREAVANAFRHSNATKIEVVLEYAVHNLRVLVRDNSCGIDPQMLNSGREGHWGLSGMRERAKRVGADLKVWSSANGGTEVGLSVPGRIAFEGQAPSSVPRWLSKMYVRRTDSRKTDLGKTDSSKTATKKTERERRAG
jgi:signal transduction histidine kinase/ligand-binding sensor domain-containing protein